jgi:hypothetical protein
MTSYPAPPVLDPRTHCRTLRPDELRPGSPEAIAAGCECDSRRNRGGRGEGPAWCNTFLVDAGCALHQQLPPIEPQPARDPELPPIMVAASDVRPRRRAPGKVHHCERCGRALPACVGRPPKVGECCLTDQERRNRASNRESMRRKAASARAVPA